MPTRLPPASLPLPLHREPARERAQLDLEGACLQTRPDGRFPRRLARPEPWRLGDDYEAAIRPNVEVLFGRVALGSTGFLANQHGRSVPPPFPIDNPRSPL